MAKKKKETPKKQNEEIQEDVAIEDNVEEQIEETEVVELTKEEELEAQLQDQKDKYLRLFAEFDNYKKRTNKEKISLISTAGKRTLGAILPIIDDFDRAHTAAMSETSQEPMSEGMTMIYEKLKKMLANQGAKEMTSTGEVFDAEYHEAITEIPAPTDEMKGKVIDTVEKGYFLDDTILRFAKVVVGK